VLIQRCLQAIRGGDEHDDTIAESHRFGDLVVTLGLDAPGLSLRFFRIEVVALDGLARQVCDEK
jgi:hypothetical protein